MRITQTLAHSTLCAVIVFSAAAMAGEPKAEFRTWTYKERTKFKATYMGMEGELAVLENEAGQTAKVKLSFLSDEDRRFISTPPIVERDELELATWRATEPGPDCRLKFSHDGSRLMVNGAGVRGWKVWDVVRSQELGNVPTHLLKEQPGAQGLRVAWVGPATLASASGELLCPAQVIEGDEDRLVLTRWDIENGKLTNSHRIVGQDGKNCVAFNDFPFATELSADGRVMAIAVSKAGGSGDVLILDSETFGLISKLEVGFHSVSLALSPQGSVVAGVAGRDQNVELWNVKTHDQVPVFADEVRKIHLLSGGRLIAGTRWHETLVWDVVTGEKRLQLDSAPGAFAPVGTLAARIAGESIELVSWDIDSRQLRPIRVLKGHEDEVRQLTFSNDGKRLASWDVGGMVKIWNLDKEDIQSRSCGEQCPETRADKGNDTNTQTTTDVGQSTEKTSAQSPIVDDRVNSTDTMNRSVVRQWRVEDGGNGHFYQAIVVPGGVTWEDANAAATTSGRYLATITSKQENDFVFKLVDSAKFWTQPIDGNRGPWLGGFQSPSTTNPHANWCWVTGESWDFTNWAQSQPNDFQHWTEDKLHFYAETRKPTWNDMRNHDSGGRPIAYVTERDGQIGPGSLAQPEPGFVSLFDGKTLEGWRGDPDLWCARDGMIIGSNASWSGERLSYLSTVRMYDDFILKVKFNRRSGNSGIQFRSQQHGDFDVTGYQADITEPRWRAEALCHVGKNVSLVRTDAAELNRHLHENGWNEYVITCKGPSITLAINGFTIADYIAPNCPSVPSGIIALQLVPRQIAAKWSTVGSSWHTEVWFKDIRIKKLNDESQNLAVTGGNNSVPQNESQTVTARAPTTGIPRSSYGAPRGGFLSRIMRAAPSGRVADQSARQRAYGEAQRAAADALRDYRDQQSRKGNMFLP